LALLAALALGACSVMPDVDSFRAPDASTLFRPLSVTNYKDKVLPPVAPEDLVDASGRCAGAFAPAAAPDGVQPQQNGAEAPQGQSEVPLQRAGTPLIPSAISLEMTECDVVKRAGIPENVQTATNERNERTATLTYINGPRPGIYSFTAGRLRSMERAPEPPTPVKPAKKPKPKPSRKVARPAQVSVQ
jgi:hypothetical protein